MMTPTILAEILNPNKVHHPPVLSEGYVTPLVLDNFLRHAGNYHQLRDIDLNQRVETVVRGILLVRFRNSYYPIDDLVHAESWMEFSNDLRNIILEKSWDAQERLT
jgi:hypothetical protein